MQEKLGSAMSLAGLTSMRFTEIMLDQDRFPNLEARLAMRSTLFLTGVGYLLGDIHRLILVTARMCCIAQQSTPLVQKLAVVQLVGAYISLFGWLFVTIERAIATVFTGNYEKKCSGFAAPVALCSAVLLLAALACCVTSLRLIKNVDFIIMGLQIFLVVMCFVALAVIVMFNTSAYRKRHNAMMQLSNRYQLDENIRGSRYLIPVALNDVLVKVAFILLMAYSIFFTDIPLGHDTTHLSHAYDLVIGILSTTILRPRPNAAQPAVRPPAEAQEENDEGD
ncbi:hypothetical protein ANCCEY_00705 [Ancylostoma ceylanicum]|uniref:Uncharacterized protein n=1 Tax=Ancylostoma ceylanicum TaxID=53326 RepID=A0A0D6M7Q4_9BILA|nr:hypothetical protein ANCCEY_00705 [Ancylostoma ceylanicum]